MKKCVRQIGLCAYHMLGIILKIFYFIIIIISMTWGRYVFNLLLI